MTPASIAALREVHARRRERRIVAARRAGVIWPHVEHAIDAAAVELFGGPVHGWRDTRCLDNRAVQARTVAVRLFADAGCDTLAISDASGWSIPGVRDAARRPIPKLWQRLLAVARRVMLERDVVLFLPGNAVIAPPRMAPLYLDLGTAGPADLADAVRMRIDAALPRIFKQAVRS